MSDWQRILHDSVDTLDKLGDRYGRDIIDVEGLQPAFDNFQMRITPNVLGVETSFEGLAKFGRFSTLNTSQRNISCTRSVRGVVLITAMSATR